MAKKSVHHHLLTNDGAHFFLPIFTAAKDEKYFSRIEWCEGHWCSSTYMIVRLSDKSSKTAKKYRKSIFWLFLSFCWTASRPYILLTQGPIWEIFAKKFWELAILKNELFLSRPFWIFFPKKKFFFCFIPMKISPNLYGKMDGSKFWCFHWFSANSLLCVI